MSPLIAPRRGRREPDNVGWLEPELGDRGRREGEEALLGSGERIFDGVESFGFEPAEVLHSRLTTHIRYRRVS